jgi:hypothetical protein
MAPFRITFADLMETARSFPQEVRDDPNRLTFTMAVSVIRHFFGQPWCEEHIIQDAAHSRPAGFLRLDFTPGFECERKTSRVLDFAETLFNLQHIQGFDDRVNQMRAGQIEASFAEFDFGRFLHLHDIAFEFVKPSGVKGRDYDCRVEYADGREACADAKCRLEGTEMRAETIRNSLIRARSHNLPSDKPGIIFVKVPQAWLEQDEMRKGIHAVADGFLRNNHRFNEFVNGSHRFEMNRNWAIFRDDKVPEERGGAHPKWTRLFSQGFIMRDK